MAQIISKNSKRKVGLTPGRTPKLLPEATEDAQIPMIQRDGSIKFVSKDDFEWMLQMGHIEKPKS